MFTRGTRALVPRHHIKYKRKRTAGTYFSARIQGLDRVLAHGYRARILAWILDTRARSH